MTSNLPVNGHAGLKPLNPSVQQRLIDDGHWERYAGQFAQTRDLNIDAALHGIASWSTFTKH